MNNPDTTAAVNRILLRTAIKAEPIVERSAEQKAIRVDRMRAELHELGYSVVTTEWLHRQLGEEKAAE